jgi:general secretion pathway protein C
VHTVGGLAGWWLGTSVDPLPAADLRAEPDFADPVKPTRADARRADPFTRAENLLERNIFCPACDPGQGDPLAHENGGLQLSGVQTSLPLSLMATMEAPRGGTPLATILGPNGGVGAFAEGDAIQPGVVLVAVNTGFVYLQNEDQLEYLTLPEPRPTKKSKKKKRKRSKYELPGARKAINCRGRSCTVDRRFVSGLLADPKKLVKQGRARPYSKKGLRGFRLTRVRRGTVPRLLGMRSGDVVTAINGQSLESMDNVMGMYAKLRHASHLNVEYSRRVKGKIRSYELDIDIK